MLTALFCDQVFRPLLARSLCDAEEDAMERTREGHIIETAREARGGERGPSVVGVLSISTISVISLLALVWFVFFNHVA